MPIHPEVRPTMRIVIDGVANDTDYVFRRLRAPRVERARDVEARASELREHLKLAGAEA